MKVTTLTSLVSTLTLFQIPFSHGLPTYITYRMIYWVCPQIHQPCWWRQPVSVRLRYAAIHSHRLLIQLTPPICKDSQCPAQRPHLQRRLQVIRLPHRGPDNRVGQNPWFRESKENNAAIFGQCTWAKIGMCLTLFNQPPRNDHCPPRPAKH